MNNPVVLIERPEEFEVLPNGTILKTASNLPATYVKNDAVKYMLYPPLNAVFETKVHVGTDKDGKHPKHIAVMHYPFEVLWIPTNE